MLGGFVADSGAPEWVMFAMITIAILVPWQSDSRSDGVNENGSHNRPKSQ